jgi:hypothetical protein
MVPCSDSSPQVLKVAMEPTLARPGFSLHGPLGGIWFFLMKSRLNSALLGLC